jgi:hypothetical protein
VTHSPSVEGRIGRGMSWWKEKPIQDKKQLEQRTIDKKEKFIVLGRGRN